MTIVAGLKTPKGTFIGADSFAGTANSFALLQPYGKLLRLTSQLVVGLAGSPICTQVLRTVTLSPQYQDQSDEQYLQMFFGDTFRKALRAAGALKVVDEQQRMASTELVIGYKTELYKLDSNFFLLKAESSYAITGAGYSWAEGVLDVLPVSLSPTKRLLRAMEVAGNHSPWVRGPFYVMPVVQS